MYTNMDLNRRRFISGMGTAGVIGLAGCTGGPSDGGSDGGDGGEGTPTSTPDGESTPTGSMEAAANVGIVYATGGLGDGSFNDQAQQGAIQAKEDLGIAYSEAQPDEVPQFKTYQQQFAQETDPDYDLVSCIGFLQGDALAANAPEFPEQNFQIVDFVVDEPNVGSYVFSEHQGSYLVGQLAGLLTTEDFSAGSGSTKPDQTTVGFVGGVEGDLIGKFEAGFMKGVADANSDVDVQSVYTGDFNDPQAGKEAALQMYNSGADIVYHASGNTGTGVFQAAQEQGCFAIGVDRDQSVTKESFKDVILASMVKRVDTAVLSAIEAQVDGEFEGGAITELGLEQEGVGIVYGQQLGSELSGSVKSEIEASTEAIIAGDISVPTDPSKV
jgi:basic membrane protein A